MTDLLDRDLKNLGLTIKGERYPTEHSYSQNTKMGSWRKARALLFKEIKDKHPEYSYIKVAIEATNITSEIIRQDLTKKYPGLPVEEINRKADVIFEEDYNRGRRFYSEEDVKNDYRAMNWKWVDSRGAYK